MWPYGLAIVLRDGFEGLFGSFLDSVDIQQSATSLTPESDAAHYMIISIISGLLLKTHKEICKAWNCGPRNLDIVEELLRCIARETTPQQTDHNDRIQIIGRLLPLVKSGLGKFKGFEVEPFGSFVSGLHTQHGDLDITIIGTATHKNNDGIVKSSKAEQLHRNDQVKCIQSIGNKLIRRGYPQVEIITRAPVPIAKFLCNNIECDISCGSVDGQFKSTAMGLLSQFDWRFGAVVRLVKLWAGVHHINDASQGTFNSYTLTLLVIFVFQTRKVPIFPPLCDLFLMPGQSKDNDHARPVQDWKLPDINLLALAASRLAGRQVQIKNKEIPANTETLLELLTAFFALYHEVFNLLITGHDLHSADVLSRMRIDTWRGCFSYTSWGEKDDVYLFGMEDPFNSADNCARALRDDFDLQRIVDAFSSGTQFSQRCCAFKNFLELESCYRRTAGGERNDDFWFAETFGYTKVVAALASYKESDNKIKHVPPARMYLPSQIETLLHAILPSVRQSRHNIELTHRPPIPLLPFIIAGDISKDIDLPTIAIPSYMTPIVFDMNNLKREVIHDGSIYDVIDLFVAALCEIIDSSDLAHLFPHDHVIEGFNFRLHEMYVEFRREFEDAISYTRDVPPIVLRGGRGGGGRGGGGRRGGRGGRRGGRGGQRGGGRGNNNSARRGGGGGRGDTRSLVLDLLNSMTLR